MLAMSWAMAWLILTPSLLSLAKRGQDEALEVDQQPPEGCWGVGGGGLGSRVKVRGRKHNAVHDGSHKLLKRNLVPPAEEASPCGAEVRRVMAVG